MDIKIMLNLKFLLLLSLLGTSILNVSADEKPYKDIGGYRIFYSSFNSSFILPEIASIYNISRGKDKGLVTIAVTRADKIGGETALLSGTASNMLAQQKKLDFFEVREGQIVYYLAPFEYYNEDILTFKVQIQTELNKELLSFSFQNKFYYEK